MTPDSKPDQRALGFCEDRGGVRLALLAGLLVVVALAAGFTIWLIMEVSQPDPPGAFYHPPDPLPSDIPGTLIRSEKVPDYHPGADVIRILYLSTGADGTRTAASGMVFIPHSGAPEEGRNVVAWAHPTTGVAEPCAPSLLPGEHFMQHIGGFDEFLAAGYVIVATDYQGLGTPGLHPYLVGDVAAMNVIDSVRAVQQLESAEASRVFTALGHSQGGHAVLFTGQIVESYAPELDLVGTAAVSPATDLVTLLEGSVGTTAGNMIAAMGLTSWSGVYGVDTAEVVDPLAEGIVAEIAKECVQTLPQTLGPLIRGQMLVFRFLQGPAWDTEPWATILADNTPGREAASAPILLVQGTEDTLVTPTVQERFVVRLCNRGEVVLYVQIPGVSHFDAAVRGADVVVRWVTERFEGAPAPSNCP